MWVDAPRAAVVFQRLCRPGGAASCDDPTMSLFRKQPQTSAPTPAHEERGAPVSTPLASTPPPSASAPSLFNGPNVDIEAIYHSAKLAAEELDRVVRAEELLHGLPSMASNTREIVDATFRAFGVDRTKILEAASRQLEALEAFIRFSHEQTQKVVDANARRIAELEAEIARSREASAKSTNEGQERARTVNEVLLKVQRVLDFFGDQAEADTNFDPDADTVLRRPGGDVARGAAKPTQPPQHSTTG